MQEVFKLRRIEGLSQREVAEKIGISENTVEKHMSRGLLLILRAIQDGGNLVPETSNPRPATTEAVARDGKKDRRCD